MGPLQKPIQYTEEELQSVHQTDEQHAAAEAVQQHHQHQQAVAAAAAAAPQPAPPPQEDRQVRVRVEVYISSRPHAGLHRLLLSRSRDPLYGDGVRRLKGLLRGSWYVVNALLAPPRYASCSGAASPPDGHHPHQQGGRVELQHTMGRVRQGDHGAKVQQLDRAKGAAHELSVCLGSDRSRGGSSSTCIGVP